METRLFSKITLSLAVMAALAACGEKAAEKPAADAAAPASAATASQVTAAPAVDIEGLGEKSVEQLVD